MLQVFNGEVEVLVHAVYFCPLRVHLLANYGDRVAVLRFGLPDCRCITGAPLFNLATRAYSHDVDFVGESGVEAIRVHDILIIEYPTLILCLQRGGTPGFTPQGHHL